MYRMVIGLIREGKQEPDSRVALTPAQCRWLLTNRKDITIIVQHSSSRCFADAEYIRAGVAVQESLDDCEILLGIKEVPVAMLLPQKTYLFFSHTKKLQPYNQAMLQEILRKKITLIDYECLVHEDGTRIIGFGFFAGIVGAHNGMMAYGNRTGSFSLDRVFAIKSMNRLIHTYFGLHLPNIKIAVTGSGRVAHGILEIMNLMGIRETEPEDFLARTFKYPVYVHLKGADLYKRKDGQPYSREHFHANPELYKSLFTNYLAHADIVMNGVYWTEAIPQLFSMEDMQRADFKIATIADITDDKHGSIPCNLGDSSIQDPVYGVDKMTGVKTAPYVSSSVDVMAVSNLPNELPRDASRYFGEQMIKYIFPELLATESSIIHHACITKNGALNEPFNYMTDYANGSAVK